MRLLSVRSKKRCGFRWLCRLLQLLRCAFTFGTTRASGLGLRRLELRVCMVLIG